MGQLRVEELSASNVVAANSLTLKPGQDQFVAPVAESIAEAYVNQESAWPRVIYLGDQLVGFVMATFNADADREEFRATILRMNVSGDSQGQGVGRYMVEQVAEEGRRRGAECIYAIWDDDGEQSPDAFFKHMGFSVVGENEFGAQIGRLPL